MDLILWRHAEAEDAYGDIGDTERALTGKGLKQAQKIAGWLNPQLPDDTRILVSPAIRTRQTADALGRKYQTSDLLFTDAAISDYLSASRWPDDNCVLLVGHQPTLGQLAALLMAGHTHYWEIKKGAVWWLRSTSEDSAVHAMLRVAMLPSMLE